MAALVEIAPAFRPGPGGLSVTEYNDTAAAAAIVLTDATEIKVPNSGRTHIRVRRTGVTPSTLTIITPKTVDGLAIADREVVMPVTNGAVWEGAGYNPSIYNDSDGKMAIQFSAADDIELSVVEG